jgi:hypothetical protein
MSARTWFDKLDRAAKEEREWRERARKVIKRYRDEKKRTDHKFNILWSNTETVRPSLYSSTPDPVVKRRYDDQDPVAKAVSEVLKRSLEYGMDAYDFDGEADQAITDLLLPGRAVMRVIYEPTFEEERVDLFVNDEGNMYDDEGNEVSRYKEDDDGPYTTRDSLAFEEVKYVRWPWEDFLLEPAKCWADVNWIAFRSFMDKNELRKRFPRKCKKIKANQSNPEDNEGYENHDREHKAEIWEVWDKRTRKQYIISKGYENETKSDYIEVNDDPLGLEQFFPIPEPLYSFRSNDTMVPIPDFCMYQDQADELDRLTQRVMNITEALRAKGLYAARHESDLDSLVKADDSVLIPVEDWAAITDKGGMRGMIEWFPVEELAKTLAQLQSRRQELIQTIYQLTGISDLLRGATDPRETARAQRLKAEFGSRRLALRQRDVQFFFRDLMRLGAEIMAEKFSPETFQVMTGRQIAPEMTALMRNDAVRDFRIDIETDSTIAMDEEAEKQRLNEALQAVGAFVSTVGPLVQAGVVPGPVMVQLLLTYVRKFRWGSELEDAIEASQSFEPSQSPENRKLSLEEQKMQLEQMKQKGEMEKKQAEIQLKLIEGQIKQQQSQQQQAIKQREAESKERLAEAEFRAEQARKERDFEAELRRDEREMRAKIQREQAETQAKIQRDQAETQAKIQMDLMEKAAQTGVTPSGEKNMPQGEVEFVYDEDGNITGARMRRGSSPRLVQSN